VALKKEPDKAPTTSLSSNPGVLDVSARRTPELVIAFVGAAGSGVTAVADAFAEKLKREFDYTPHRVKVSDLIREQAEGLGRAIDPKLKKVEQIRLLQDVGNDLRKSRGPNILAKLCVERIAKWRVDEGGYQVLEEGPQRSGRLGAPLPKRWAHIINELKHPEEVKMLRDVYGDLFWLVAVMADERSMERGLITQQMSKDEAAAIIKRDENEAEPTGQKVRDTVQLADYFIRNDPDHLGELEKKALRFLDLIFNVRIVTPNVDEAGMSEAFAAASSSACLSRQVGAAVYSEKEELLGVGWNDVPRFGGGLYSPEDAVDNRCFAWRTGICHNDAHKEKLNQQIITALKEQKVLKDDIPDEVVAFALKSTDIRGLIEFSRSVHAEMAAILSVARSGTMGLTNGTLYVTTFPCHSCARHIVAAGISRVVYVEPYPKSLATELHDDAVFSGFSNERPKKVHLVPYEGTAPRNIFRLFKHGVERKENGKAKSQERTLAEPVTRPPLDGFTVFEGVVVRELTEVENSTLDKSTVQ
jgi:deoxycytidylate deaminase